MVDLGIRTDSACPVCKEDASREQPQGPFGNCENDPRVAYPPGYSDNVELWPAEEGEEHGRAHLEPMGMDDPGELSEADLDYLFQCLRANGIARQRLDCLAPAYFPPLNSNHSPSSPSSSSPHTRPSPSERLLDEHVPRYQSIFFALKEHFVPNKHIIHNGLLTSAQGLGSRTNNGARTRENESEREETLTAKTLERALDAINMPLLGQIDRIDPLEEPRVPKYAA